MDSFLKKLKIKDFEGELETDAETLEFYSHDASIFELTPKLVAKPKNSQDVQKLVQLVAKEKSHDQTLSITGRSAGTCMSGGAINDSIIIDFTPHINQLLSLNETKAVVQPGMFYRDFEVETLKQNTLMPTYPASKTLAAIGGMVNNNAGGEKSLEYGKTADWVRQVKVVFADGNEYTVEPLNKKELDAKIAQNNFEGNIYKTVYELCEKHYQTIKNAKPHVSKNSMGYGIWDVWDRKTGVFDLTRLIVGSQGTLGMTTEVTFDLVKAKPHSGLLVLFLKDITKLGELINTTLKHKPATFECFDDATLLLSIRFMPYFLKMLGPVKFLKLIIGLAPDGLQFLKGVPKLVLMVEFSGDTHEEVTAKIKALHGELGIKRAYYEVNGFEEDDSEIKSEKFWTLRRNAFNLLRNKVKEKHTAPFIDDFVVNPQYLPEFLPKIRKIIKKYKLFATIQGHAGDGNFHIIPLMEIEKQSERDKLLPAMKEVNDLVLGYGGSLSGEHNDGLVRGPWLEQQFGKEMLQIFKQVKHTFDPDNIFNPHKKSDANWDYSFSHIRKNF
jgi:FAD/FMN-containing dehydrogenase